MKETIYLNEQKLVFKSKEAAEYVVAALPEYYGHHINNMSKLAEVLRDELIVDSSEIEVYEREDSGKYAEPDGFYYLGGELELVVDAS